MHVPTFERDGVKLYEGSAIDVFQSIKPNTVDVVLTDPPYSSGGLHLGEKRQTTQEKYVSTGVKRVYHDFSGDSCDQFSWLMFAHLWLSEAYRVCRKGAHCYTFCDWRQLAVAITAMQGASWQYRGLLVWDKTHARGTYPGSWHHGAEYLVWGSKGKPWTSTGGKWAKGSPSIHNVIPVQTLHDKVHVNEKPVDLLRRVIRISSPPGGTVLDCFAGSGSCGVAAIREGRQAILIEREDVNVEIAATALRKAKLMKVPAKLSKILRRRVSS